MLCYPMDCSTPGLSVPHHLPKFAQVHVHCIGDAIQPSHPLIPSSLSALNFSQKWGLFLWVAYLYQWPKYWSFSVTPSIEYSGLISLEIDWFALLAVQGTLQESSPALCLLYSPALTTTLNHWEDHSLDIWIFVGRVMCLLFNTLSRFVITFLPRSKDLLTSCLQSPSTVILEPKERKSVTTAFSPICHEVWGRMPRS